jgi:hypothetical protein
MTGMPWLPATALCLPAFSLSRCQRAWPQISKGRDLFENLRTFSFQYWQGFAHWASIPCAYYTQGKSLTLILSITTYGFVAHPVVLCLTLVAGILAQSGGFFLHMMLGREGERSFGTLLTFFGAALLAVATLALAFGLAAFHA